MRYRVAATAVTTPQKDSAEAPVSGPRVRVSRVKLFLRFYAALLFFGLVWTGIPDATEPYYAAYRAPSILVLSWGWYFVASRLELIRRVTDDRSPLARGFANADPWFYVLLVLLVVADALYLALVQARTLAACPLSPLCDAPGELGRYAMGVTLHVLMMLVELVLLVVALIAGKAFSTGPALSRVTSR